MREGASRSPIRVLPTAAAAQAILPQSAALAPHAPIHSMHPQHQAHPA